jgi:hypothetical protein
MLKNTTGLQKSAHHRSQTAMEKAQSTIRRMQAEEASINFRTVAARAGVSTAWLYKTKTLRDRIMKLRSVPKTPVENESKDRRILSQERVIATLRLRIKQLEAKNAELSEGMELAYGELAARSSNTNSARRGHIHDMQRPHKRKKSLDDYR